MNQPRRNWMNAKNSRFGRPRSQRGAALFLAIIFLALMTILAVTASSTSIMQERMTGGLRNSQIGLMGAESTLRGGEGFLWNLAFDFRQPLPPCIEGSGETDCVYYPSPSGILSPTVQAFRTSTEWINPASDGGREYDRSVSALTGSSVTASLAAQPRFIIEYLGSGTQPFVTGGSKYSQGKTSRPGEHHIYRITSRSQGGNDAVVRVTESYYSAMNMTNTGFNPDSASGSP